MKNDLISRQKAIEPEAISKWKKEFREYVDSLDIARDDWKGIIEYIDELPSIQPERKTGRWEPFDVPWYRCSECGAVRENITFMENFCPNCGADMRGDKHETD